MTEPIAVDAPAKPAFSRSAALPPGVGPLVEALTGAGAAAAPKVEPPKPPAPKAEPPKPAEPGTAAAVTTAAVAAAGAATGAAPAAAAAAPAVGLLSKFTKKQLTIGAAVCSLFVGAGALRLLFPAKDAAPKVETAANEKALTDKVPPTQPISAPTPPPTKPPALQEEPRNEPGGALPALPPVPPGPVNNSGAKITGFTPVMAPAPPSVIPEPRLNGGTTRPEPDFSIPPLPGPVTPAAAAMPVMPPAPPATGTPAAPVAPATGAPPLPVLPMLPGSTPPPVTTPPAPKPPAIAPPSELAPVLPTAPGGGAPKPAAPPPPDTSLFPGVAPAPVTPKPPEGVVPMPPGGMSNPGPALPALPGGTGMNPVPAPVDVTPRLPAIPEAKPMGGVTPPVLPAPGGMSGTGMGTGASGTGAPSVFPVADPGKPPGAKPPAPVFDPPAPAFPASGGTSTGFTKPAGATEVKPTAPDRAPRTSYDVDVYDPKLGDTYESISQEWYNSKQYAAALKAFNQNQNLQGGRYVNVPPLYVLQRQSPTGSSNTGGARPTITPVSDAPNWGAPATTRPAATGRNTFTVPRGGMTLQQIARQTMSSEQRWRDIYDLNPQITNANELLPQGTELKMPADAKLP